MASVTKTFLKNLVDTKLADFSNITPDEHRELWHYLLECISYDGDIRFIRMSNTDISVYFDASGLGRIGKQYEGWAICNGNNGTEDDGGLTYIGYDPVKYPTLGVTLGSKDSIIVEHDHDVTTDQLNGENSQNIGFAKFSNSGSNDQSQIVTLKTSKTGQSGTDKNLQPSRVILKIQKVPI